MITIRIFPLALGQPAMFEQTFEHALDADRYVSFWQRLGHCHIKDSRK